MILSKETTRDPIVQRMLDNFKLSEDADKENRKTGLAALKFRRGGKDQWEDQVYSLFGEQNKPRESYNQIPQFVHRITNDMRVNMPQTRFSPGSEGSKEVAEIYEDLARAIQHTSEAEVAYDIAADSQVTIGWGYWRYLTDYENDLSFDQVIKIAAIPNPFTIYDDPNCLNQDFSDRRFLIQVCDIPVADFNAEYEKDYGANDLKSIGDSQPDWATDTTVRVAEYWEVRYEKGKLYRDAIGNITMEQPPAGVMYEARDVKIPRVKWHKCTACEVIESKDWIGKFIPYVRVSGETLVIDGKVYYSGVVEGMMPCQRQFNYWMNSATEMVALAPKSPFVAAVGQLEGLEHIWDQANVKNYPYLPYKPVTINGTLAPPPSRLQNGADIGSMMLLVKQAQENFYATTGIYPASLGAPSSEKSGRAILARQNEGNVSTFHYPDNMARALRFGGRIMADLFPKIYDGSRNIKLLKEDKTEWEATINQQFVDEKTGQPKILDMTAGLYDVAVTTGASYATKRIEMAESMMQMAQAYPPLMQAAGPEVVRAFDWPGAEQIAEALERALPPQLQKPIEGEEIPPQVQAALQQSQVAIQQLQGQLQETAQALQAAEEKVESKQADIMLKQQELQQKTASEELGARVDLAKLALEQRKLDLEEQKIGLEAQKLAADIAAQQVPARMGSEQFPQP